MEGRVAERKWRCKNSDLIFIPICRPFVCVSDNFCFRRCIVAPFNNKAGSLLSNPRYAVVLPHPRAGGAEDDMMRS